MNESVVKTYTRAPFYLVAAGLQPLAGLLLLPVLIATLSSEEFTRYGLMTSSFHLLVPILTLNLHLAPGRLYFDCRDDTTRADLLLSTLAAACGLTVVGLALMVGLLQAFSYPDPVSLGLLNVQLMVAATILFIVVIEFGKLLMKVRGDARLFAIAAPAQGFGLLLLVLLFRQVPASGLTRVILAYCLAFGLIALAVFVYAGRFLRQGRVNPRDLRAAFAFSWPTVVHLVALWAVSYGGRWIGALYISLEALAPYTLLTILLGVIGMLARAIFAARFPEIGTAFGEGRPREGASMVGATTLVALAVMALAYVGSYVLLFGFGLQLPAGYQPTRALLGFAAVASLLDGFYLPGFQILYSLKKTRTQAVATILSGVLTTLLSFLWAQTHGVNGLMLALIAGLGLQAITSNLLARYHLRQAPGGGRG